MNRSAGALQVLGTPAQAVYFTSYFDEQIGLDTQLPTTFPKAGDWGGIIYRNDLDNAEERFNYEDQGIFLNYVNHADIRYGGGNVEIDSVKQIVTPVAMVEARPTITFNSITVSADAPVSADPNSFEETNFHAPVFQLQGTFTSDYERVGPDLHANILRDNSSNGLFIRISTLAGDDVKSLTVPGRFDDTDIVHILAENLQIAGSPGEPILELKRPSVNVVTLQASAGGGIEPGTYHYKVVFVDANGFEGRPSEATSPVDVAAGEGQVAMSNLPTSAGDFIARRIYRSSEGPAGTYLFVAQVNASDPTYVDTISSSQLDPLNALQRDVPSVLGATLSPLAGGSLAEGTYSYRITYVSADGTESPSSDPTDDVTLAAPGGVQLSNLPLPSSNFERIRIYRSQDDGAGPFYLAGDVPATQSAFTDSGAVQPDQILRPESFGVVRARTDARLAVDPGTIVKLEGTRIETTFGAQFIAEGTDGREVVFTSRSDDRFGAGGTFDTNGNGNQTTAARGDWGGLYVGNLGVASIDHALLTYGGGVTKIEGTFKAFNILEVHQADLRLANSVIEQNANGQGGQGPANRFGRGYNEPATIFIRGAQPVIVDNVIQHNTERAITLNANSFTSELLTDYGRSTGLVDKAGAFPENRGPLIRGNRLLDNPINGIDIRGAVLTTMSVWDDTDIVHVLRGETIIVPEFHSNVGLRLESNASSSLVVKMDGRADNFRPEVGAGFTATGRPFEIGDRIGGTMHIVGQPDFPVVLTSLSDDAVGAGLSPSGATLTDTDNDGIASVPRAGDWRSVRFDQYANDRNVELIIESEATNSKAPGENATPDTAQFLGALAVSEQTGDDNLRLGFEIIAVLNEVNDVDTYSFNAAAGTEVWLDIDRTTNTLDTVVELIDANGELVARTDNSLLESADPSLLYHSPAIAGSDVNPLQKAPDEFQLKTASGLAKDLYSLNTADAGMRVVLPGVAGTRSTYHVRVRSSSNDLDDLGGGLTRGSYQLQVRLREMDEVPGVTVRYADIRYATNGIELYGLPAHSPLLGEVAEDEDVGGPEDNNAIPPATTPAAGPQDIGNLLTTDRGALSIAGNLSNQNDIDIFEFQVKYDSVAKSSVQHASTVFDVDYADGMARPNTNITVFDAAGHPILMGTNSNIADDRPRPLTINGDMSDLSRGSVGTLDPFIGPVSLPEGTYFVAVTSEKWVADELVNNTAVRLEPVNSVRRIADDHVDGVGLATGDEPVVVDFIDYTQEGSGLWGQWHVTDQRSDETGHGTASVFDDSRGQAARVLETEPNDTIATSQDLEQEFWHTGLETSIEQSTDLPHVTVVNGWGDTTRDYYGFEVAEADSLGIFDIDIDWDEILSPVGEPLSADVPALPMDADLRLWDELGNLLATSLDAGGDPGSPLLTDPMIQFVFPDPGRYYIEVTRTLLPFTFLPPQEGDNYTLHVSVENHRDDGFQPDDPNQSLHFGTPDLHKEGPVLDASNTNPIVITTAPAHCLVTGSPVTVALVNGNTNANGDYTMTETGATTFELDGRNGNAAFEPSPGAIWTYDGPGIDRGSGSIISNSFSLAGYAPEDLPRLYFNYLMNVSDLEMEFPPNSGEMVLMHQFNVYVRHDGDRELLVSRDDDQLLNIIEWRQARLDLSDFAGIDNLQLEFEFNNLSPCSWSLYDGVYIDDIIVGFAERGEMITFADANPAFAPDPESVGGTLIGPYQLEMRTAEQFGTSQRPTAENPRSLDLFRSFDTNDRLIQSMTLVAPPASSIADGDTFTISDGNNSLTFEYTTDMTVTSGNVAVSFAVGEASDAIAESIRDAINSSAVQGILNLSAGMSDGTNAGSNQYHGSLVNLYGNAIVKAGIDFTVHDAAGDSNLMRDQGQVVMHSNFVTDARDWGIIADAGMREKEPGVPAGFLQSHAGPVRNLRELNNDPPGGLTPGVVIENNVIAGEGLGGIHVSGSLAPLEIVPPAGPFVCDGQTFTINAYRTTLTFEFEDISGGPAPCGSTIQGGDGWTAGNIPVTYRQSSRAWILRPNPPGAYTQAEMAVTIRDAIQGSILVTNGTTMHAEANVYDSRWLRDPITLLPFTAAYVDNISSFQFPNSFDVRRVPLGESAQPFARVVNNTVFGNDGMRSFYPGSGLDEPNDTMLTAVETHQGRQHRPDSYETVGAIGDGVDTPADVTLDVDFYKLQLQIGERVIVDIDAASTPSEKEPNNSLAGAQNLDDEFWTLDFSPDIGNQVSNTSTTIPHASVQGDGDGTFDYYAFTVNAPGELGIFDIDYGFDGTANGFDAELYLYDNAGNLLASNLNAGASSAGAGGSINTADPYLEFVFTSAGRYVIGVAEAGSTGANGGITGNPPDAGDTYVLQVSLEDHETNQSGVNSVLRLFDSAGQAVAFSDDDAAPGERDSTDSYLDFTASSAGTYYVGVSGKWNDSYDPLSLGNRNGPASGGTYKIAIDVHAPRTFVITAPDGANVADGDTFTVFDVQGSRTYEFDDANAPGVQAGHIAVPYNSTPIPATGDRGPGYRPPEMAVVMAETIGQGLTGVTAVPLGGQAGASGTLPTQPPSILVDTSLWGVVGFGHDTPLTPVVATTELYVVVSGASRIEGSVNVRPLPGENVDQLLPETGVLVSEQASPTLLNNVLANLNSGIWQDASPTTVVGANTFQHNDVANSNLGAPGDDFNTVLGNYEALFVDAADGDFYPAPMARSIDSALDSLGERSGFATVKTAMGISISPILAPDLDAVGLLRSDDPDVDTPSGQGANVFKDRGGLDRADFLGPDAVLIEPRDNDAAGIDLDQTLTVVQLAEGLYSEFSLQLVDGFQAAASGEGVGVDDLTVTPKSVSLSADNVLLQEGEDYTFRYNATTNTIRLTPLSGQWDNDRTYVITLPNEDRFVIEMPDGGDIVDGQTYFITDLTGGTVTFEFESGYSLFVPATLNLYIPRQGTGAGGIADGQRLTIFDGTSSFTFEYDANTPPNYLAGNIPIDIRGLTTAEQLAQVTADTIAAAGTAVTVRNLGGGAIHVGGSDTVNLDVSRSTLTQSGQPGVVTDGQTISVTVGTSPPVVMEFDSDGSASGVPIPYSDSFTQDDIAQAIADTIASQGLGLSPDNLGGGLVHVGGTVDHQMAVTAPNIRLEGRPGVRTATTLIVPAQAAGAGGIADGQWFSIDDGLGQLVRFEFDDNGDTVAGSVPVLFAGASSVDELANVIIAAIKLANVGIDAPVYHGGGRIELFDSIRHSTDVSYSELTKTGVPGGVVPLTFVPDASFDQEQMTTLVLGAIADSKLTNVTTLFRGGGTYFLDGAKMISGLPNFFIGAIKDVAGNHLQPNQPTNRTQFVILMPNVELDFGDAPAQYPTLFGDNGARHAIIENPLFLGSGLDADDNGQPSGDADLDDDDGVVIGSVFNRYLVTPVTVTSSARGILDAWVDFNQDGDWNDPGEQVLVGQLLLPGDNDLGLRTPALAKAGFTYARFRVSSVGGLLPNGVATDGEVEDYRVEVVPGSPPEALDDSGYATDEDSALDEPLPGVLANDSDDDGTVAVMWSDAESAWGATIVMDLHTGLFHYDPTNAPALQGLRDGETIFDTFHYQATDGRLPSTTIATVTIEVTGVNDIPVATDDSYATNEDTAIDVGPPGLLENDSDDDADDDLTVTQADTISSRGATIAVNPDGSFRYDPTGSLLLQSLQVGEQVPDQFSYTVEDESGASSMAVVEILVTGRNDGPTAVDDAYDIDEDQPLQIGPDGVLGNDWDMDGDPVQVVDADAVSSWGAIVTVNADGSFTYDPTSAALLQALDLGDSVDDTFQYTIEDDRGARTTATVTVDVAGRNDAPLASDDAYGTDEDHALDIAAPGILDNDSDVDADDVLRVVDADPTSIWGASVTVNADGGFTYDPTGALALQGLKDGEQITDRFSYEIEDLEGVAGTATVLVTVTGINDRPTTVDDSYVADEDHVLLVVPDGVLDNDTDVDGDAFGIVDSDSSSSMGAVVSVDADGGFSYDPRLATALQELDPGDQVLDTFTYTVQDVHGDRSTATVTVRVSGRNDSPNAMDDLYSTDEDHALDVAVPGVIQNDEEVDADDSLSVNDFDALSVFGAEITMNANGSFRYDPTNSSALQSIAAGQMETDQFTYEIKDENGATDTATVQIQVMGVNDAPTAADDQYGIDEDHVLQVDPAGVLGNDEDIDGDSLEVVSADATSTYGAIVTVHDDGSFTYDPTGTAVLQQLPEGGQLLDTFGYMAADVHGENVSATVVVRVTGVNDEPVAVDDVAQVPRNGSADVNVVANDLDIDGAVDNTTVAVMSPPVHGAYQVLASGSVRYTPDPGYSGPDSFTYTVRDNRGDESAPATVSLNINGAPVAVNDDVSVFRNSKIDIAILDNDSDVDGTILPGTVDIQSGPAHGNVVVNPDGTLTYTPLTNYVGGDTLTYTVRDNDGDESNEATVSIGVIIDPYPWQNPRNPLDVNDDGFVTAIDALIVINDLNFNGARRLPNPPQPPNSPPPYLDPSGDNEVAAVDALLVINFINEQVGGGGGEGEAAVATTTLPIAPLDVSPLLVMAAEGETTGQAMGTDPVHAAERQRGELREEDDYRLRIGRLEQQRCAALGESVRRHRFDEVLEEIAEEVSRHHENDVWEDVNGEDWWQMKHRRR